MYVCMYVCICAYEIIGLCLLLHPLSVCVCVCVCVFVCVCVCFSVLLFLAGPKELEFIVFPLAIGSVSPSKLSFVPSKKKAAE
jgi:hypothetical protein